MAKLDVVPYDEDKVTGDLRYVQMVVTTYISLTYPFQRLRDTEVFLWCNGGPNSIANLIHYVWVNFQTSTNNINFGNRWRHLLREIYFWKRVGGIDISLALSSFGKDNTQAFDSLLQKLHKYVRFG